MTLAALTALTACAPPGGRQTALAGDASQDMEYLFAYFKGRGDGLHLAHSVDGLAWNPLRGDSVTFRPTIGGEKLFRDPSIVRGTDGTYHMVWTTGWRDRGFGYARSRDLVTWTDERFVPAMAHEPLAMNTWAPDLFYDSVDRRYVIVWASTIPRRYPASDTSGVEGYNHRLYYTTTTDFSTFAPTALFYEPGFSVIDATIVRDGARYVMLLKNETDRPPQKNIRLAFADRIRGPWSPPTAPITGDYWAEGPTILRVGSRWILYVDRYRDGRFAALRSRDLVAWADESQALRLPRGIRHGTAFPVPAAEARRILERGR